MNTREEQIELVKKLLKTGVSDDARMVLEKQFPEVKEGRNERIRQTIIELIEWVKAQVIRSDHFTNGIKWDEMIAYLEKHNWKPSAEQMLTLCCACRKVTEQEAECLDSLYNDLKELM